MVHLENVELINKNIVKIRKSRSVFVI